MGISNRQKQKNYRDRKRWLEDEVRRLTGLVGSDPEALAAKDREIAELKARIAKLDRDITNLIGDLEEARSTKDQARTAKTKPDAEAAKDRKIASGSIVEEIEQWAKGKSRAEKINLAADLVDPLVGRARFGLDAIYKILDEKAERDGQNIPFFNFSIGGPKKKPNRPKKKAKKS
jgi:hypothetical protein